MSLDKSERSPPSAGSPAIKVEKQNRRKRRSQKKEQTKKIEASDKVKQMQDEVKETSELVDHAVQLMNGSDLSAQKEPQQVVNDADARLLSLPEKAISVEQPPNIGDPWLFQDDMRYTIALLLRCQGCDDMSTIQNPQVLQLGQQFYHLATSLREIKSIEQLEASVESFRLHIRKLIRECVMLVEECTSLSFSTVFLRLLVGEIIEVTTDLILEKCCHMDVELMTLFVDTIDHFLRHQVKYGMKPNFARALREKSITRVLNFTEFMDAFKTQSVPSVDSPNRVDDIRDQIERHYRDVCTTKKDEEDRIILMKNLEMNIRSMTKWRQSELALYGSSMSMFGFKSCDLDICLVRNNGKSITDYSARISNAKSKKERLLRIGGSLVEFPLLLNQLKTKIGVLSKEAAEAESLLLFESLEGMDLNLSQNAQTQKQKNKAKEKLRHLSFFVCRMQKAAKFLAEDIQSNRDDSILREYAHQEKELKKLYADEATARKALYELESFLRRLRCTSTNVIAYARVPLIKFTHPAGFDCDLCLDNSLAVYNTRLLRTYAQLDERVRQLVYAVKWWAKSRGINEASTGTLSSYSYSIWVIHFLQNCAPFPVLPNLQDPRYIAIPTIHGPYNVSFCDDIPSILHRMESGGMRNVTDSATLLLRFFRYFGFEFNYLEHVISISKSAFDSSSPGDRLCAAYPETKETRWKNDYKRWRISIEDPFDHNRDLGCVLSSQGQVQVLRELKRAYHVLANGGDFQGLLHHEATDGVAAVALETLVDKKATRMEEGSRSSNRSVIPGQKPKKSSKRSRRNTPKEAKSS